MRRHEGWCWFSFILSILLILSFRFGSVRGCGFMQCPGFGGANPDRLAVAPHGQRLVAPAMVFDHFGDGIGEGLHGLLRQ